METTVIGQEERMFRHIEQSQTSGKTKKEYCREHEIAEWRYYYWQKKYRETQESNGCFVPIRFGKKARSETPEMELHYPNGVSLKVSTGIPMNLLKNLINLY